MHHVILQTGGVLLRKWRKVCVSEKLYRSLRLRASIAFYGGAEVSSYKPVQAEIPMK
jgi:hypothetical protein